MGVRYQKLWSNIEGVKELSTDELYPVANSGFPEGMYCTAPENAVYILRFLTEEGGIHKECFPDTSLQICANPDGVAGLETETSFKEMQCHMIL